MPYSKTHTKRQQKILGNADFKGGYDAVNKWIDEPHKWLGKQHRRERHDLSTPLIAAMKFNSPKAGVAAAQHILDDTVHTQLKKLLAKVVGKSLVYE